jgi:hypothetical protein
MKTRRVVVGKTHPGPFSVDVHRDPSGVWLVMVAPAGQSPIAAKPLRSRTVLKLPDALKLADGIVKVVAGYCVSPANRDTEILAAIQSKN